MSRTANVRRANASTRYAPGLCLRAVRSWCAIPARYPSAASAWRNARGRHTSRRGIPAGVPVWTDRPGGSRFGHITLCVGADRDGEPLVRTIDYPRRGRVSTVRLDKLERAWGHRFIGWADTLNGRAV